MGVELNKKLWVVLCLTVLLNLYVNGAKAAPQVPCFFIFGDSLIDAGNNNVLNTWARADYPPYGCDFLGGFTGRFTNGRTVVDFLAQFMGFDHLMPPSRDARGQEILQGVNFASGAGGIRPETAYHLGQRLSMSDQVKNFTGLAPEMARLLGGPTKATAYLKQCIYYIGLGSNDYLNNYFQPQGYNTSKIFSPVQYASELIKEYSTNLMLMYAAGARKFVLNGVGQLGCTPSFLAHTDGKTCAKNVNDAISLFNERLRSQADILNKDRPDARFTYVNAYSMFQDIINKASTYGFKVTKESCCGIGKNKGEYRCYPSQPPCPNRNEYVFWDAFHPTEATNMWGATKTYASKDPDVHPIDVQTMAKLKL